MELLLQHKLLSNSQLLELPLKDNIYKLPNHSSLLELTFKIF